MNKNSIIISDGTKGMENQSIAASKALNLKFKIIKIKPNFWLKILPNLAIYFHNYFTRELDFLKKYRFKYLITTGKRMSAYSILSKIIYKRDIVTIHLQNPKINPNHFDVLIVPRHDKISGKNIIKTQGALSFFDKKDIKKHYNVLNPKIKKSNKPITLLLIGGNNKRYKLSYSEYCKLLLEVRSAVNKISGTLFISISRRTPKKVINFIKIIFNAFGNNFHLMNNDVNLYPGILKITDYAIVTSDSINMISELASTRINLFIYYFKEEKSKILEFNTQMQNKMYAKKFEGKLFTYDKKQLFQNNLIKKNFLSVIDKNSSI